MSFKMLNFENLSAINFYFARAVKLRVLAFSRDVKRFDW